MLARPDAMRQDLEQLCAAARAQDAHAVCVCGAQVELACSLLEDSEVKVSGLVGFPFGAADADAKRYETEVAIDHGAQEIETVLSIGRLKDGDHRYVLRELRDIAEAADERPVKVILEMSLLTAGGSAPRLRTGARFGCALRLHRHRPEVSGDGQEVQSLRAAVGEKFGVKAAGLSDVQTALALMEAGATRLGAAEASARAPRLTSL